MSRSDVYHLQEEALKSEEGPFPTAAAMWKYLARRGLRDLEEQRPLVTGDGWTRSMNERSTQYLTGF